MNAERNAIFWRVAICLNLNPPNLIEHFLIQLPNGVFDSSLRNHSINLLLFSDVYFLCGHADLHCISINLIRMY